MAKRHRVFLSYCTAWKRMLKKAQLCAVGPTETFENNGGTMKGNSVLSGFLAALLVVLTTVCARGQGAFQPYGLDQARFDPNTCNPSVGCPDIGTITAAGVQWIRMAAWWWFLEPNAPDRSQAMPGVYGRLSGLHTYDLVSPRLFGLAGAECWLERTTGDQRSANLGKWKPRSQLQFH